MDDNLFLIDATNTISSPVVIELKNSTKAGEGFNRLKLVVTALIDMKVDAEFSDSNIKLIRNSSVTTTPDTNEIVYDIMVYRDTPFTQLTMSIDNNQYNIIIKNV